MTQPKIEFVPMYPALPEGTKQQLEVLLRIHAPRAEKLESRPPLNIAIVLDRSGWMSGPKIEFAREAARHAVELLAPGDRLSLLTFADEVETLAIGAGVAEKAALHPALSAVETGGSTALHAGWAAGTAAVRSALVQGQLARVILLSDGQANRGEQRPAAIAAHVAEASASGVSTTTMGVGTDFNEDLLESMAQERETATTTSSSRPRSSPTSSPPSCRASPRPSDLMHSRPIEVRVRLEIDTSQAGSEVLRVRLAWDSAKESRRQRIQAALALPQVTLDQANALPPDPIVKQTAALLGTARSKRQAIKGMDLGDISGARRVLAEASSILETLPPNPDLLKEKSALRALMYDLDPGDSNLARKKSSAQAFDTRTSKLRR